MKLKYFFSFAALLAMPVLSQVGTKGYLVDENTPIHAQTTDASGYRLVFSDEFNDEDGARPNASKWVRCERYNSPWSRWLAINDEEYDATGFIHDGHFVARALPNPYTATDNVPMITGGIKSMNKFCFTYGKVECRLKTNPYSGNFPALWMLPEGQGISWPESGEIDIWEAINTENISYHTVHTNWTYNLENKTNPPSSFTHSASQSEYHIYGLEWDDTSLKWYVDGTLVGTYTRSTDQSVLDQGQWPFDKAFYLILNQSVGDGSWAYNADVNHTYETRFDWIRVYQKEGQTNNNDSEHDEPYCGASWGRADSYYARHLNSLVLTGGTEDTMTIDGFDHTNTHAVFNDCTNKIFRADAGSTISLKPVSDGDVRWIHGYIYIDYNNDGQFTPDVDASTGLVGENSELVAYSYYGATDEADQTGFDSKGTKYEGGASENRGGSILEEGRIPAFNLPANLKDGNYRMRFKMDWNCIDPCGNKSYGNRMNEIGGYIIDFTLQVGTPTGIGKVEESEKISYHDGKIYTDIEGEILVYDLSGRLVKSSTTAPMSVDGLTNGMYVVRINRHTLNILK